MFHSELYHIEEGGGKMVNLRKELSIKQRIALWFMLNHGAILFGVEILDILSDIKDLY